MVMRSEAQYSFSGMIMMSSLDGCGCNDKQIIKTKQHRFFFQIKSNYVCLELFCFAVEGIGDLPRGHYDDVDEQKHAHHHKQLVVFDNFLVQFDVRENRVDPPGLAEHRSERQRETCHQAPSSRRANVRERL